MGGLTECMEAKDILARAWDHKLGYILTRPRPGKMLLAHRHVYTECFGEIPAGLLVCHHCDNRSCVNPEHLFLGTNQDNSSDMVAKDRQSRGAVHCTQAKVDLETAREMREIYSHGGVTQRDLAKRFGLGQSSVSRILRGHAWAG